jgi:hypothetical protein
MDNTLFLVIIALVLYYALSNREGFYINSPSTSIEQNLSFSNRDTTNGSIKTSITPVPYTTKNIKDITSVEDLSSNYCFKAEKKYVGKTGRNTTSISTTCFNEKELQQLKKMLSS